MQNWPVVRVKPTTGEMDEIPIQYVVKNEVATGKTKRQIKWSVVEVKAVTDEMMKMYN